MNIGPRIKELRMKAGITQAALAAKASLSHSFVCQIEKGKHKNVGTESLIALAKALKVKIEDLLRAAA